jgi:hypothetical protein
MFSTKFIISLNSSGGLCTGQRPSTVILWQLIDDIEVTPDNDVFPRGGTKVSQANGNEEETDPQGDLPKAWMVPMFFVLIYDVVMFCLFNTIDGFKLLLLVHASFD